jgi:hypothetical protein
LPLIKIKKSQILKKKKKKKEGRSNLPHVYELMCKEAKGYIKEDTVVPEYTQFEKCTYFGNVWEGSKRMNSKLQIAAASEDLSHW